MIKKHTKEEEEIVRAVVVVAEEEAIKTRINEIAKLMKISSMPEKKKEKKIRVFKLAKVLECIKKPKVVAMVEEAEELLVVNFRIRVSSDLQMISLAMKGTLTLQQKLRNSNLSKKVIRNKITKINHL